MGAVQAMSLHGSKADETECWSESTTKAHPDERSFGWVEEASALESPTKLRWSLGVGKKEDWEGRAQRVTFTQGIRKKGWQRDRELLSDEE